jgi:leucyl aminopeptidase
LKIKVLSTALEKLKEDVIIVGAYEDQKNLSGAAAEIERVTAGLFTTAKADITGKLHQTCMLYAPGGLTAKRVLVIGLGREKDITPERVRGIAAKAVCTAREAGLTTAAMPLQLIPGNALEPALKAAALCEGALLGLYTFRQYKTATDNGDTAVFKHITIAAGRERSASVSTAVRDAETLCAGVYLARDLVNHPANAATPTFLADTARALAKKHALTCKVFDQKKMQRLGMGALLGVARGSHEPARFIVIEYATPQTAHMKPVVLVGKAITFDSGGISIKPANNMEEMKTDMSGGAAVLGAIQVCAGLKLPLRVVGLIPATENLPGGSALKPGDVITSMSGKTIEIITTDAEGRLILADALHYARRYKPQAVIDLATLTGACVIALGNDVSAVMGTSEPLIERLRTCAEQTGEKIWPLPMYTEYDEQIKSTIADMKNVGGRGAGSITAGCFLKKFTEGMPWAHLDIAGTAWAKQPKPYAPVGATGVGVRLLVSLLRNWQRLKP